MTPPRSDASAANPPIRPIGAIWPLSLRSRLALFVALGVAGIVALLSVLQVRLIEGTVETQLVDSGRATAQAVADGMRSLDETDIPGWLHDFIEAEPAV